MRLYDKWYFLLCFHNINSQNAAIMRNFNRSLKQKKSGHQSILWSDNWIRDFSILVISCTSAHGIAPFNTETFACTMVNKCVLKHTMRFVNSQLTANQHFIISFHLNQHSISIRPSDIFTRLSWLNIIKYQDWCPSVIPMSTALRWRYNGRPGVSNHQPHDCLFNRLFRRRSKKTSKLRVTGLCAGSPRWISRTNGQ